MSDKKITDLQLRSNVNDDVNLPADDGIQTYRVTAPQVATYALAKPRKQVTKSATYTATDADHIIFLNAATGWTLALPTAVGRDGKIYKLVRIDTDGTQTMTIDPSSTQTIDGATTYLVQPGESLEIVSDNANWQVATKALRTNACFSAWMNATYAVTAGNVIKYDSVDFDTHEGYDVGTGLYTVPVKGKYLLTAAAYASNNMGIGVKINGSSMPKGGGYIGSNTAAINGLGTAFLDLDVGDTVGIFSDTSCTIETNYGAFNMVRVSD